MDFILIFGKNAKTCSSVTSSSVAGRHDGFLSLSIIFARTPVDKELLLQFTSTNL